MGDMRQRPEAVVRGKDCVIILQPILEDLLQEVYREMVEMVKPDESWGASGIGTRGVEGGHSLP